MCGQRGRRGHELQTGGGVKASEGTHLSTLPDVRVAHDPQGLDCNLGRVSPGMTYTSQLRSTFAAPEWFRVRVCALQLETSCSWPAYVDGLRDRR